MMGTEFDKIRVGDFIEVAMPDGSKYPDPLEVIFLYNYKGEEDRAYVLVPKENCGYSWTFRSDEMPTMPPEHLGKVGSFFIPGEIISIVKRPERKEDSKVTKKPLEKTIISSDGKWLSNIDKFKGENPPESPFRWL